MVFFENHAESRGITLANFLNLLVHIQYLWMENINLFNHSPIMHQLHYTAKQVWRCIAGEAMYRDNCGLIYIYI